MNCLAWNTRGLGGPESFLKVRKLIRQYSPGLVFLSETHLQGSRAQNFRYYVGFPNCFAVDSVGRSGGLLLLWKEEWDVSIRSYTRWHIDAVVKCPSGRLWRFTGFYGHPTPSQRVHSWALLSRLKQLLDLPWCVVGDFNEILDMKEKSGGTICRRSGIDAFKTCLDSCSLRDLPYTGDIFSWCNRRAGRECVKEKLDRAVANSARVDLFSEFEIAILDFWGSDHRVVQILLDSRKGTRGPKRNFFCLEPWWFKEEEISTVVSGAWKSEGVSNQPDSVGLRLKGCGKALKKWSREKFGAIPTRINTIRGQLSQLQSGDQSEEAVHQIRVLETQFERLLTLEEHY